MSTSKAPVSFPAVLALPPTPSATTGGHPTPNWTYTRLSLNPTVTNTATTTLNPNLNLPPQTLLIRMHATGICHTDLFVSSLPEGVLGLTYPKVLGHEGSGVVEAVSSSSASTSTSTTGVQVGDWVLLSYHSCGACGLCEAGETAYCERFGELNTVGTPGVFALAGKGGAETVEGEEMMKKGKTDLAAGGFFGQSSFASWSVVHERCVVKVGPPAAGGGGGGGGGGGLVKSLDELRLFAPLGCGLMTGAGAVVNVAKPRPEEDVLLVLGLGGVGLGAVMAAKVLGCTTVIAVDRVPSRLALATDLGASHVLDTTGSNLEMFATDVQALVGNRRITHAIDTTGSLPLVEAALASLGKRGRLIQIGVPDFAANITLPMADYFLNAKRVEANYLGDAVAKEFIPKMIGWYREGLFPLERLVTFFPAERVGEALVGMERGDVVKPVLVW